MSGGAGAVLFVVLAGLTAQVYASPPEPSDASAALQEARDVCAKRSDGGCVCITHVDADAVLVRDRVEASQGVKPCSSTCGWWAGLGAALGAAVAAAALLLL